jgi:hypothetical protein
VNTPEPSPRNPLRPQLLEDKFLNLVGSRLGPDAAHVGAQRLSALEGWRDMATLSEMFCAREFSSNESFVSAELETPTGSGSNS